jgi:hypothetical protein
VIDLDQPAQPRTPPAGGRRRLVSARALVLVAVGSLLAGVVLGGAVMHRWRYQPLAASVEVSVLLFAQPGLTTVHTGLGRVRIEAQVTVVNAGPEPLNVLAVRVEQRGVTVRSPEQERQIAPGTASPVDVTVEWDCVAEPPGALGATVRVETVNEQVRDLAPVALDAAPWVEGRRAGCARSG